MLNATEEQVRGWSDSWQGVIREDLLLSRDLCGPPEPQASRVHDRGAFQALEQEQIWSNSVPGKLPREPGGQQACQIAWTKEKVGGGGEGEVARVQVGPTSATCSSVTSNHFLSFSFLISKTLLTW